MTRNTSSISFFCRNSKVTKAGVAPLELGITINGKRVFINLPLKAKPEDFARKRKPDYIQEFIDQTRVKVNQIITDMVKIGEPLTAYTLREYFRTGGVKSFTVGDAAEGFLALKRKEMNAGLMTFEHYRKYTYARDVLYSYINKDEEITKVTPSLVRNIYADLRIKYHPATSASYALKIKAIIRYAIDNGKLAVNPFFNLKIERGKRNIEYLTDKEVALLNALEIENKSLSDVRDAFILQASTGLAYCDVVALRKEDITITEDGTHYICKNRQKTGTRFTSVILPMGVEILKKHNYQLHILSNQKYNLYLKTLQSFSGIETRMTTHLARRTYATMLLNHKVRIETVSKALGHSNTKITQAAYAHLLDSSVIEEISQAM